MTAAERIGAAMGDGVLGEIFSGRSILPDGDVRSHIPSRNVIWDSGVPFYLMGRIFCQHYGAVSLWVGTSGRRLMGFSIEHVNRVDAALDEMVRINQELGLY